MHDEARGGASARGDTSADALAKRHEIAPHRSSVDRCIVVGIGASAGGLDAFREFLEATPSDSGLAFVLIQHLDPTRESMMAELLSKYTAMPVVQARNAMRIEPNTVYMIPPNKFIELQNGGLYLDEPSHPRGMRLPIDHFFRSLAEQRQERAIGVVLSGTGSDGVRGLEEIKARGGMVMVQEPTTAAFDGMPRSAVAAGIVDFVLPIERMPRVILSYVKHPYVTCAAEEGKSLVAEQAPDQFRAILDQVRKQTDYDFRCYKRGTLGRRIQRRMGLHHVTTLNEYLEILRENPDEIALLCKDVLINVTSFFRDKDAWAALEDAAIAPLVARKKGDEPIRIWTPGCATGEEAYSLAIAVQEQLRVQNKSLRVQLFATDLDADAIRTAREAIYPATIEAEVPVGRLERYFTVEAGGEYRLAKHLRESTVLAVQNLIADPPFSNVDIISCRNVMIYLEAEIQQELLKLFHFALAPGGFLFLGSSETAGRESSTFEVLSKKWRIYRKREHTQRSRVTFPLHPSTASSPGQRRATRKTDSNVDFAQRALLERFVPATVVVNRRYEVQFFHGNLRDYLEIPRGEPTVDLIAMCRDGLRAKLREAVQSALSHKEPVRVVAPRVKRNGRAVAVTIRVEILVKYKDSDPWLGISFEDAEQDEDRNLRVQRVVSRNRARSDETAESNDLPTSEVARQDLEHELRSTREDLQSTIEELETSNEELRASNEEIMSMNEEFQSTNEELETSREELQSLNEELSTVNSQLEEKVGEVEASNDDLLNLLRSTQIATIFLDTNFCIRRFTPATMELLHVIASDVGRPIADLSLRFNDTELYRDARVALRELTLVEKQVCVQSSIPGQADEEGSGGETEGEKRWFMRRVLPYRTCDDTIDGVVITFTEVTQLTDALTELEKRQAQASALARLGRIALTDLPLEELFDAATNAASETLGTEFAKVLELKPDGESLVLRAGVGWDVDADCEPVIVPAGLDSQAGYTLQSASAVIVEDLKSESRFHGPQFLRDHGVRSGLSVIIGRMDEPWGVFGTHSRRVIHFTTDDANFIEAIANLLGEAIRRDVKEVEIGDRERQLRLVTDAMPALIAYCDRDLIYRFCNARYKEWFDLEPGEVIGRHLSAVIGSDAFESIRGHVEKVLRGEQVAFETAIPYKRGSKRHVQVQYVPHVIDDRVEGYFAMIEDIDVRRQHEQTRARLASIVEHSRDAIIGKDLTGAVTSWNRAAERLYGYSAEEMIGQPVTRLVPEGREHEVREILDRLLSGEQIEHFETVRRQRAGSELFVDLTVSPVRDLNDDIVGASVIVRDITERRERERLLRESEFRLKMAKLAAGLGIYDYDIESGVVEWDRRVREIWGGGVDEVITYETFLRGVHVDDRERAKAAVDRALAPDSDGHYHVEYRVCQRGTGKEFWVRATGLVTFENGKAVRLVGAVQDISESRRTQDALLAADRRKDEFLATLGHELRNPLAALVNTVESLRRRPSAKRRDALYDIMSRQTAHMTSLMNDLLDIGRITRGDVELRRERVVLRTQFDKVLEVVQSEIEARGHRLEVDVQPTDLVAVVDPVRLEQVLINLIGNAVKYTPDRGTITLRGAAVQGGIEVVVEDTGIGFETEAQSRRIFDLFYQGRKGSGGLGIGLSLVKSLVELHGGDVDASSDGPGHGCKIRIRLPSRDAQEDAPALPRAPVVDLRECRVVVVDDHEDSLAALEFLLQDRCIVRTASCGQDGLDEIARFRPHVCLLDLALPDMSGFDVAAQIGKRPDSRHVLKIAMTGFGDAETAGQVAEAGFHAHLIKPVDIEKLVSLIGEAFEASRKKSSERKNAGPNGKDASSRQTEQ